MIMAKWQNDRPITMIDHWKYVQCHIVSSPPSLPLSSSLRTEVRLVVHREKKNPNNLNFNQKFIPDSNTINGTYRQCSKLFRIWEPQRKEKWNKNGSFVSSSKDVARFQHWDPIGSNYFLLLRPHPFAIHSGKIIHLYFKQKMLNNLVSTSTSAHISFMVRKT